MATTCQAVSCDSASLRSYLAGLSTCEASAEVGQLLQCGAAVSVRRRRAPRRRASRSLAVATRTRTALAGTYDYHFGGRTYRLRLFKAVTGHISGPHRAGYITSGHHKDGCLTGHDQARLTGDKI